MPEHLLLCGYDLVMRDIRLDWAPLPYEGYDRNQINAPPGYDAMNDDGTEYWSLYDDYIGTCAYIVDLAEARRLQEGFSRNGLELDIIRVQVDCHCTTDETKIQLVPPAKHDVDANFEFLGFDCGWLLGAHSIIHEPGLMTKADEATRQLWASRLNSHGLFPDSSVCQEFRSLWYTIDDQTTNPMEILEISVLRD